MTKHTCISATMYTRSPTLPHPLYITKQRRTTPPQTQLYRKQANTRTPRRLRFKGNRRTPPQARFIGNKSITYETYTAVTDSLGVCYAVRYAVRYI